MVTGFNKLDKTLERSTFDFTSSQINEYTDLANSKNIYWATE